MKIGQPNFKNHFFLPEDQALFDYEQIFTVSSMWIDLGMENIVGTFDLLVRDMPPHRNFLLFGGLEEIIESIKARKYTKDEVDFLLKAGIISPQAAKLFRRFQFSGDIWAMPEGTIFFPGEVVVRLTGPLWQINLFTFFLINTISSNVIFFSKLVRCFLAADNKVQVVSCPSARAHSNESSLKYGRLGYFLGAAPSFVPSFARKFNLPINHINNKAYHAFIKSFASEIEAMRGALSVVDNIGFMVDTYDYRQGIKNVINVAREFKPLGKKVESIILDSGKDIDDFIHQAHYARQELNRAGFKEIRIVVAGNFEEYRISQIVKKKAPIDGIIIGTETSTSSDAPKIEAVFKLAEFIRDGNINYCAKLTPGKESYPGRKQVFRDYKNGKMIGDIVGLADEKLGTPLLQRIMVKGKCVFELPTMDEIKEYTEKQLLTLPDKFKKVDREFNYPVKISAKLKKLFTKAKKQHLSHLL